VSGRLGPFTYSRGVPARPVVTCVICERSLLLGERSLRFSPDGRELVDVCPLCRDRALELGWYREGGASHPVVPDERRRRRGLAGLLGRRAGSEAVVTEPALRRLSRPEQAVAEAAELFNASTFRRAVEGIARSLGAPLVSIVPLSGVRREVVITVAWDISWYQYRVDFESGQAVRLAERGYELDELDSSFVRWNAHMREDGLIVPEVEPR